MKKPHIFLMLVAAVVLAVALNAVFHIHLWQLVVALIVVLLVGLVVAEARGRSRVRRGRPASPFLMDEDKTDFDS